MNAAMQVINETELLQRIDGFLERHAMAPTTFGRKATGEPQLIDSIRKGRSPSLKVVNRLVAFIDETDAEAELRAKLAAEPPLSEEDTELPFSPAPVNPTGASSPTSSPTTGHPLPSEARDSSPTSSCSDSERTQ